MPNDKVTLYFTSLNPTGLSMLPKMKRFTYKRAFESGLHAYDKAYVYTSIEALQTLLNRDSNSYDGIHVYSDNAMKDIDILKEFLLPYGVGVAGWVATKWKFLRSNANGEKSTIYRLNADNSCSLFKYNLLFTYDSNE